MFSLSRRASALVLAVMSCMPGWLAAADADWIRARDAFRSGRDDVLAQATLAMDDSVLAIYGEFWQLWRRLKDAPSEDVRAFLQRQQGDYLAEKLRAEWLRQLAKRQDWATFRAEYPRLVDTSDVELGCLNLQAQLAAGNDDGLAAARDALWFTAKDQPSACDPVIAAMQARGLISEEQRWQRLRLALDGNATGLARHLLQGLDSTLDADALKQAADAPADFIARADLSRRDAREVVAWAWGRWARQDFFTALARLKEDSERLGAQAPVAWRQIALAGARRFDPSSEDWFRLSESAWWPDTQVEARLRQLVRQGQWEAYATLYPALPERLRESRAWQYWQARALAEKGRDSQARRLFAKLAGQEDYYGLLAADRLGQTLSSASPPVTVSDEDKDRLSRHQGFRRAFALFSLGQRWESVNEWNWAVRQADDRLLLAAAQRASEVGWYDRAIYAAERTRKLTEPRYLYLAPYREVTRGYAAELGLDEAWVYGLIRQESRFVNNARSGVGAGGLMQLMPGTAQWVANRIGVRWHAEIANDAGQNVRLGTYYLNHILNALGHPVLATAGYNAGPRRAREWQADTDLEGARYVEGIPFFETREYVKKVMTNAVHYARVFGQGETRLSSRLGMIPARTVTPVPIDGP